MRLRKLLYRLNPLLVPRLPIPGHRIRKSV